MNNFIEGTSALSISAVVACIECIRKKYKLKGVKNIYITVPPELIPTAELIKQEYFTLLKLRSNIREFSYSISRKLPEHDWYLTIISNDDHYTYYNLVC